jgi:hypothetical protein
MIKMPEKDRTAESFVRALLQKENPVLAVMFRKTIFHSSSEACTNIPALTN